MSMEAGDHSSVVNLDTRDNFDQNLPSGFRDLDNKASLLAMSLKLATL